MGNDIWSPLAEGRRAKSYSPGQMIYLQGTEALCVQAREFAKKHEITNFFDVGQMGVELLVHRENAVFTPRLDGHIGNGKPVIHG